MLLQQEPTPLQCMLLLVVSTCNSQGMHYKLI